MSEDQIKRTLGHLDYPYDAASWAVLKSKLDSLTDPPAVGQVDRAMHTTLKRLTFEQQPAFWGQLSQSFERIQARQHTIRWMKATECLLVAVLLWGFSFWGAADGSPNPTNPTMPPYTGSLASGAGIYVDSSPSVPVECPPASTKVYQHVKAAATPAVLPAEDATTGPLASTNDREGQPTNHSISALQVELLDMPQLAQAIDEAKKMESPTPSPMLSKRSKSAFWALGISGEQGYFSNGEASDRYGAMGLAVYSGFRKAKWQYQAGFNLGHYLLNTLPLEEFFAGDLQTGYVGHRLIGSRATVASLPVQVHRQLVVVGRIRAAAVGGFAAHVAVNRFDDYEVIRVTPPQGSAPVNLPVQGKPQQLTTHKGIFQGGALEDNLWTSAQLGLQLEYPLGLDKRIFLQQVFSRDLGAARLSPLPGNRTFWTATAGIQFGF
jgi:hypothetical protein